MSGLNADDQFEKDVEFVWPVPPVRMRWCVDMQYYDGGGPSPRYVAHDMTFHWTREEARWAAKYKKRALGPGRKAEYRIQKVFISLVPT